MQASTLTVEKAKEKIHDTGKQKRSDQQQGAQPFAQSSKKLPKRSEGHIFTVHPYTAQTKSSLTQAFAIEKAFPYEEIHHGQKTCPNHHSHKHFICLRR